MSGITYASQHVGGRWENMWVNVWTHYSSYFMTYVTKLSYATHIDQIFVHICATTQATSIST